MNGSGQNTGGHGGKERKRKNKGKDVNEDHVSNVTGGDSKGEARYCFLCGAPEHLTKDCTKKGNLKCVTHPEATSNKNRACWVWRCANGLPVTTSNRSSSKERNKETPPPPMEGGGGAPPH